MMRLSILLLFVHVVALAQPDIQKKIQTQLIEAEDGSTIELPAGKFFFTVGLSLEGKKNVTIKGQGMDKTQLSFKDQLSGAEGLKVTNGAGITLQDFTVEDSRGDGIKTQGVNGIRFQNVKVQWTRGANPKNGGYGLYPVQCNHVLIDNCVAIGASDAGIYVGQSNYIVVKNSKAMQNVAGIEIENSMYADVHDNEVTDNTGGILVFDLPDLIQKEGGFVRVFKNNIHHNNHNNFAPEGNIVGKVPPGTGVMILATRNVEVFENKIVNNISVGTGIISYYMTENPINDPTYKPYPSNVSVHHNYYQRPAVRTTGKGRFGKMFRFKLRMGKDVPHIFYDGIEDEKMPDRQICIADNTNGTFMNLDAAHDFKGRHRQAEAHQCEGIRVKPVVLTMAQ
ncbi:MAG: parallel beta-helix domain-containing protein [Bacteroidota bacterium]